jgi:hypothetical protein
MDDLPGIIVTMCLPSSEKQPSGVTLTLPKLAENAVGREDLANRDNI